jgi:bifunctional DNA-binding transcriptional regulator/antitoxin component of YhaV-PrlF toxin-antitoxin module
MMVLLQRYEELSMSELTINESGQIALPAELRERHGFKPQTPIRVIETRSGVLLVPLTDEPMDAALRQELAEWQSLSASAWDMFGYDEPQP